MLKRIQHPFQSARSDFQGARNEFQNAKSNFQAAKIDFRYIKIDFQGAKSWNHQNSVGSIRFTGYNSRRRGPLPRRAFQHWMGLRGQLNYLRREETAFFGVVQAIPEERSNISCDADFSDHFTVCHDGHHCSIRLRFLRIAHQATISRAAAWRRSVDIGRLL